MSKFTWLDKTGKEWKLSEMTDEHLDNAMNHLLSDISVRRAIIYLRMERELMERARTRSSAEAAQAFFESEYRYGFDS